MTVMFTPDIVGSFPDNMVEDAYLVAVADNSGLVVGSVPIFGVTQTSLVVWGDDAVILLMVLHQMKQSIIILLMEMNYLM